MLESRPDLSIWHHADLDNEFTARSGLSDFNQYLELENRLFSQLDALVYAGVAQTTGNSVNRYSRGSLSDPGRWPVNWNRTFILHHDNPSAAVLLLHGLSDSPYSMRALGERLHQAGATVLGLRIPGHGTAPSGLKSVTWRDMAAAVRLAADRLANRAAGKPIHIVGYSTGAALALDLALDAQEDSAAPQPAQSVTI